MCWWRRICYSWRALSSEILILYSFVYRLLHPSGVWSRKTPRATSTILPFCPSPSPVCCQSIHPFLSWSVTLSHIVLSICLCLSLLQLFNSFSPLLSVPFLTPFLSLVSPSFPTFSELQFMSHSQFWMVRNPDTTKAWLTFTGQVHVPNIIMMGGAYGPE